MKYNYLSFAYAALASLLRFYSYGLFGLSAGILSAEFLEGADSEKSLTLFYGIFSLAVFMRPIGSYIFGYVSDLSGRINSITITMSMAIISNLVIFFTPSYAYFGIYSLILLTISRILFLVSLGGEVDAIRVYVVEKFGHKNRFFTYGLISCFSQIGVLCASLIYTLAAENYEYSAYSDYSAIFYQKWRYAFFISAGFGLSLLLLRRSVNESQAFLSNAKSSENEINKSFYSYFKNYKQQFFYSLTISGLIGGLYNFAIIFFATYLYKMHNIFGKEQAAIISSKAILAYLFGAFAASLISNKVKILSQIRFFTIIAICCIIINGYMLENGAFSEINLYILTFSLPLFSVPLIVQMQNMFPLSGRVRLYSISHSIGSMIFSSSIALICMILWQLTNISSIVLYVPLFYLIIILILSKTVTNYDRS